MQSMEIVSSDFDIRDVEAEDTLRLHVDYTILVLQWTFDTHEATARNHNAVLLKHVGSEDDVGDARFIFKRKEDEALGSARPLPCDHATGNAHILMIGEAREVIGCHHTLLPKHCAMIGDGVRSGGQAGSCIVGGESLISRHFSERHGRVRAGVRTCGATQQRADGTASLLNLPQSVAAMLNLAQ